VGPELYVFFLPNTPDFFMIWIPKVPTFTTGMSGPSKASTTWTWRGLNSCCEAKPHSFWRRISIKCVFVMIHDYCIYGYLWDFVILLIYINTFTWWNGTRSSIFWRCRKMHINRHFLYVCIMLHRFDSTYKPGRSVTCHHPQMKLSQPGPWFSPRKFQHTVDGCEIR